MSKLQGLILRHNADKMIIKKGGRQWRRFVAVFTSFPCL